MITRRANRIASHGPENALGARHDLSFLKSWIDRLTETTVGAPEAAEAIDRVIRSSQPSRSAKLAYTIPEVIRATGIGRSSLYEDIGAGRLRTRKRGRCTIILAGELQDYLEGLPMGGTPA